MSEIEYGTLMFHGKPIGEISALRFAEVARSKHHARDVRGEHGDG